MALGGSLREALREWGRGAEAGDLRGGTGVVVHHDHGPDPTVGEVAVCGKQDRTSSSDALVATSASAG